ncbi:ABC-2 type transport system permease protein [Kineosphaera limosa]|uniref:ABC transporter permease protein n=1 Tax=Kineosphaera limosa NBRC 100340 TaxID=1184609 RepID=K6VH14_9MICO|nr:ABC transporter permease [Kineosphaera limosa]NYE01340.1 ABC-2 type transport system permease protein [Kineosphaera limosa]GAB95488.1 hypothetical protein KILIM_021_00280 [Kineosphaera limosa NBRC 100340]
MSTRPPESVIHDLGYRGYDGPRLGLPGMARALFVTGLRHAWGLGRSGRSRVLPFLLLGAAMVPAAVMVGIMAMVPQFDIPVNYAGYPGNVQVLIAVYAAAQAPVLFSRDLQFGSIVLYLARPLGSALFATVRWLSLTTAIAMFTLAPVLVLYLGALLTDHDVADQSAAFGKAVLAILLLSAMLATITGIVSSLSTRRGLPVVISIALLIVGSGVVAIAQELAIARDGADIAAYVGLASPFTVYSGIAHLLDNTVGIAPGDLSTGLGVLYVLVALGLPALGLLFLMRRFAKVGSR